MPAYYDEGRYQVKITAQAFGKSPEKHTPFFGLEFFVCGQYDPVTGELTGVGQRYVRETKLWITDGTFERTLQKLRSLGFEGSSFKELNPESSNHHSFVDVEVDMVCQHEDYNGKAIERWELPGLSRTTMANDASVIVGLDAKYGKKLKDSATKSAHSKSATRQEATDDVPF